MFMASNVGIQQLQSPFNLGTFAEREQRRVKRLIRACYAVGHTHPWFVKLSRRQQEWKVREWVENSLKARAIRRDHVPDEWEVPEGFWGATHFQRHGIPNGVK